MYTSRKVQLKLSPYQVIRLHMTMRMACCVYNESMNIVNTYYKEKGFLPDTYSLICMYHKYSKLNKWSNSFSDYLVHRAVVDAYDAYREHVLIKHERVPFKSLDRSSLSFTLGKPTMDIGCKYVFIEGLISKDKRAKENLLIFNWKNAIPRGEKLYAPEIQYDGTSFYLAFSRQIHPRYLASPKTEGIGIDVGLKTLASLSNGMTFENILHQPKIQNMLNRLERLHNCIQEKKSSCTIDGEELVSSNTLRKMELRFKKLSKHLSNIRHNFLHEVSKKIVLLNPEFIAVETLDISSMRQDHRIAVKVQNTSLKMFLQMLEYKAKLYNIPFIKIEQKFPSSKICSFCGHVKGSLALNERTYVCDRCGFKIDRDINAAVNLYKRALYMTRKLSGCSASFMDYYSSTYRSWMRKIVSFIN